MTLQEIKNAVDAGQTVHWSNAGYQVIKDRLGQYLIGWNIGGRGENYWGLTHQDETTLNGKPSEFYIVNKTAAPGAYRYEFPDFDYDLPTIPGFLDESWHNDAMPSLHNETLGLRLWCDYADPSRREHADTKQFCLTSSDTDSLVTIAESDDLAKILTVIAALAACVR